METKWMKRLFTIAAASFVFGGVIHLSSHGFELAADRYTLCDHSECRLLASCPNHHEGVTNFGECAHHECPYYYESLSFLGI